MDGKLLPVPSDLDDFNVPKDCDLVVRFAVRVTPPDLSERVNVYLTVARADTYGFE